MSKFTSISFAVFFMVFWPLHEVRADETWDTINDKLSEYNDNGDCKSAWMLLWENRNAPGVYGYLMLSALAAVGEHPWLPKTNEKNDQIAFAFAISAIQNSQITSLDKLDDYKSDSLFLPLSIVEGLVRRLSGTKGGKYYDPSFATCMQSVGSEAEDKFGICFGRMIERMPNVGINSDITGKLPTDLRIECAATKQQK